MVHLPTPKQPHPSTQLLPPLTSNIITNRPRSRIAAVRAVNFIRTILKISITTITNKTEALSIRINALVVADINNNNTNIIETKIAKISILTTATTPITNFTIIITSSWTSCTGNNS
jgi:hypothetical protein